MNIDESAFGFHLSSRMRPIFYEIDKDGCWIPSVRMVSRSWYPSDKKQILVYHYVYWLYNGLSIHSLEGPEYNTSDELVINHKCEKGHENCINPDHMEIVTRVENIKYSMHNTRKRVSETHKNTIKEYCRGENSSSNILTEGEAKDIIILYSKGYRLAEIHRKYDKVSYNTVRQIAIGNKWNYLYKQIIGG